MDLTDGSQGWFDDVKGDSEDYDDDKIGEISNDLQKNQDELNKHS